MKRSIPGIVAGALVALACSVGGAQAQEIADVTILNDHLHVHKVLLVDAEGDQHVLGFVGHDQLKSFDVPTKYEVMGPYRIALQQYLPLPQIGVPADPFPMKLTPVLDPGEAVSIIVGNDNALSSVEVVSRFD